MKTKEPVTTSGWYELEDGRLQRFNWKAGQLIDGPIVNTWAQTRIETKPGELDPKCYCSSLSRGRCDFCTGIR